VTIVAVAVVDLAGGEDQRVYAARAISVLDLDLDLVVGPVVDLAALEVVASVRPSAVPTAACPIEANRLTAGRFPTPWG
jgi:hypothetical protein